MEAHSALLKRSTFDRLGAGLIRDEWGRITRFLESSRLTLLQAAMRWAEHEKLNPIDANLEFEAQGTLYRVSLEQHIAALRNMWPLYSSALVFYFALAETAAAERLGREDMVGCNGIEDWAEQLLAAAGAGWRSSKRAVGPGCRSPSDMIARGFLTGCRRAATARPSERKGGVSGGQAMRGSLCCLSQ